MHIPINTICLQIDKWGQTKTPTWPLLELLPRIAEAGFTDVEAWGPHLTTLDADGVAALAGALDQSGLEIPSVGAYVPIRVGQPLDEFWDVAGAYLSLCTDLGISMLRMMPGAVASAEASADDWEYIPQVLAAYAREAAFRDVTIVAETHANTLADTPEAALRLIEQVNQLNFKLLFQSLDFQTDSTLAQWEALRAQVVHVHLQNRDANRGFVALAAGTLDYATLIARMKADGYDGDMVIEFTAGCVTRRPEDYDLATVLANAAADRQFAMDCWESAAGPPEEG